MKTRDFLRRYAYVYLYVAAFFLGCAGLMRQAVETAGEMAPFSGCPVILIDAGHGGVDGGATSCTGVLESQINLEIALLVRIHLLFHLQQHTCQPQPRGNRQNHVPRIARNFLASCFIFLVSVSIEAVINSCSLMSRTRQISEIKVMSG